ncbi:hypothetical protein [Microbacterium gorillae]|uniref:hypothetical protein n=1 Tax=Microbacterium gorillae TaxID=1231063 RepID=UPI0005917851|nr:hypothetical protein [Microbacterium gorillae]
MNTADSTAERADRRDIITTLITCGAVAIGVVIATVNRFFALFDASGLTMEVQVPLQDGNVAGESGDVPVGVWHAFVTVPDPSVKLVVFAVLAVLAGTIGWLSALGCVTVLALDFSRGRVFGSRSVRMLSLLTTSIAVGVIASYVLTVFATNVLRTEAGIGAVNMSLPPEYWLGIVAAVLAGVLAVAFRRGAKLQKDTEGLV